MPVKKKAITPQQEKIYLCSICGKDIHGEHVYIKTRRRSELRIHFECMPGKEIKP